MDLQEKYGLTRIINANGKMTALANARVLPEIKDVVYESLDHFFDMNELNEVVSRRIAAFTGAEAGFVTACAAAGITLAVAAAMTGKDLGKVAQLPDTTGMKNEVVLQKGHAVNFGAPVTQMIRLAGAKPVEVGSVNGTAPAMLAAAINENTAAMLFVVSHHTVHYGGVPLVDAVRIAHAKGVPVIVDGAAQSFLLRKIVAAGADVVVCSGHKYLAGTVAGMACGRKDLIEAMALQNQGIGRTMKVGKEGIFGLLAALEARAALDVEAWSEEIRAKVAKVRAALEGIPGVRTETVEDVNGNPFCRARVHVDPRMAGLDAYAVVKLAARGNPSVRVRPHHVDEGYFDVDVVELTGEELELVIARLQGIFGRAGQDIASAAGNSKTGNLKPGLIEPWFSWLESREAGN
ncbi:MAG TPA: aminotransferase class V-fold PLP-dependent enzyme [Firmicutes bacterium]|nr:aminotransferase class V-fold PLP-dependent enzyme [Bacillota bacterium]